MFRVCSLVCCVLLLVCCVEILCLLCLLCWRATGVVL